MNGCYSQLGGDSLLSKQMRGNFAQIPNDTEPGHDLQRVVGDINLPPEEALARRSHKVMMVIVPALAEGEESQEPIVAAGVRGFVAARTKEVRERIDGEGVMPQKHGAQAETPHKEMPSANKPQRRAERDRRHHVVFVQPAKFGELGEVADVLEPRVVVFVGDDPANVRPEKSEERG